MTDMTRRQLLIISGGLALVAAAGSIYPAPDVSARSVYRPPKHPQTGTYANTYADTY